MLKTVILIGGPQKGTRFRPLSLDIPKPLFPVAGFPTIYHHIEAASQVPNMKEVLLLGFYQANEALNKFIQSVQHEFKIVVRYLQEFIAMGTAGGMYHFRDQILSGGPEMFFVMNGDVCGDFPLNDMLTFHKQLGPFPHFTIMVTEATRQQSLNYGCVVENKDTHEVMHYVEKPGTFVSTTINGGVYLFTPDIFKHLALAFSKKHQEISFEVETIGTNGQSEGIFMEQDILRPLAGSGTFFVFHTDCFWSQIKSAGAAIYANRQYLKTYHRTHKDKLAQNKAGSPKIVGDVYIHPTAAIHPSAVLGPNVTIGMHVNVGAGVRVRESIVLNGAMLQDRCCVLHAIVGWGSIVGKWSRVEGTPNDPNPNKPFAKIDIQDLFTDGRFNPAITVIGSNVTIPAEVIVLNAIVLPDKDLTGSYKNRIIL